MKKRILSIVALAALVALPMSVFSANSTITTESVDGRAKIIDAIEVLNGSTADGAAGATPLEFGTISKSAAGGTVVITAVENPTRVATGVAALSGSDFTNANFVVKGTSGNVVNLTLVEDQITINNQDGAGTMTIDLDLSDGTLNLTGGYDPFYVGGTLNVGPSQTNGQYVGTFAVTAQYN